jgi:hypothetical protein
MNFQVVTSLSCDRKLLCPKSTGGQQTNLNISTFSQKSTIFFRILVAWRLRVQPIFSLPGKVKKWRSFTAHFSIDKFIFQAKMLLKGLGLEQSVNESEKNGENKNITRLWNG